jgi:hypothetical protein
VRGLLVFEVLPGGVTHRRLRSDEHKILATDTRSCTLFIQHVLAHITTTITTKHGPTAKKKQYLEV